MRVTTTWERAHLARSLGIASHLLVAVWVAGCGSKGAAGREDASSKPTPLHVRVAPVTTSDFVREAEVVGEVRGVHEVLVFAQVPERIRALHVEEGARVKAGDLLVTLRSELLSDGVRQAEAGVEAARANVGSLEDQVRRAQVLVKAGTLPRSQLDGLEARLRAARAQVQQLEAALSSARNQMRKTTIRAPIDGVVSGLVAQVGDMVAPTVPLCTIVDDSALRLELRVPERTFLHLEEGMPVRVHPLAQPGVEVRGSIALVGPVVDRRTRTGLAKVALEAQAASRLVAGSTVRVFIEVERRHDVVQVPASAVVLTPETEVTGEAIAFVVEDGVARRRRIHVGERQGASLVVRDGLKPGETLIVRGAHLLKDGRAVVVDDDRAGGDKERDAAGTAPEPVPAGDAAGEGGGRR